MLCLPLALILLAQVTHSTRTAYVTSSPLVATLDRIFEKLERLTIAPTPSTSTSKTILSDDEEEILSAMKAWGGLSQAQLDGVAKDLQRMRADAEEERAERLADLDYADMDDNDEEYTDMEYHNDGKEDEDEDDFAVEHHSESGAITAAKSHKGRIRLATLDDDDDSSPVSQRAKVTPSELTRDGPSHRIVSAASSIAATNRRPRVLDDSGLTAVDRMALGRTAMNNMGRVVRENKCLVPQPRWLSVRQLAPTSDTMFMPPCVELHRCAPDSGCCNSEAEVCAPIEGKYVDIPFYLHKAKGSSHVARMVFFNHTTCACVARDTLQTSIPIPVTHSVMTHSVVTHSAPSSEERQNDWQSPSVQSTVEPNLEEDVTAPSQIRRCTCPNNFLATTSNGVCSCGCGWREPSRRRDCLYFSRGKEYLGLKDRECIEDKVCAPPVCDYGAYDRRKGKCPKSKKRFHEKRHHQERNVV